MTTARTIGALILLAGISSLAGITLWLRPWDGRPAPSFALDAARGAISSQMLAGRPYALFFGFTHCPDICPTTVRQLADALEQAGPATADLKVYFVTVDPERDTPTVLADYLSSFNGRIIGLSGTRAQIDRMLSLFGATAVRVPTSGGYVYDHSTAVYLIGRNGRIDSLLNIDRPVAAVGADLRAHAAAR